MVENNTENLVSKEELEQKETVETPTAAVEEAEVAAVEASNAVEEKAVAPAEVEAIDETPAPVAEEVAAPAEVKAPIETVAVDEFAAAPKIAKKPKAARVLVADNADFDWDALVKVDKGFSGRGADELGALYEKTLTTVQEKEVVEGKVISMNKREVVIDIGYKSDGIVSLNEFRYNPELKPKDLVEVYIESLEDLKGQMILSHKKARALRSWDRVNEALEKDEIIKGYIKCRTKGGMIVDVFGIEAFLPGSQIDVKPIRDYDMYVDKTMEFKVVKINHEFRNVVVSHKALIEAELDRKSVV